MHDCIATIDIKHTTEVGHALFTGNFKLPGNYVILLQKSTKVTSNSRFEIAIVIVVAIVVVVVSFQYE